MAEPMYRQIAEDQQHKIEAGELERGAQLATEIELQRHYDASRKTIREAIKWLMVRGLVEIRAGQGTFVVEKIKPFVTTLSASPETGRGGGEEGVYLSEVQASHRVAAMSEPRVELHKASRSVARILRLEDDTQVVTSVSRQATFARVTMQPGAGPGLTHGRGA